jgi:predicted flap endonuclease-1-like 5' DNA nuclease
MGTLAQYNLFVIVIAVVIGLVVAFWAFRRATGGGSDRPVETGRAARSVGRDGPEGNSVPDEFAAASTDVAGEILGVDAHPVIPGPSGPPDDLQRLKGVGPKLAAQLNAGGITRYDQLARLSANEVAMLDARMGAFRGRIEKDRLVEQACFLERGDTDGFEAQFGKLGG